MSQTVIVERQIADQAITDAKIKAGANIATSKLADGANFIKRDGTVPFTGSINAGSQPITNVGTPSATTDAATKSYVDSQIANLNSMFDSKPSARVATVTNIANLNSTSSTIDGVVVPDDGLVLVRAQTNPAQNGLYRFISFGSTGSLTRDPSMNDWSKVPGAFLAVEEGATFGDTVWLCTSNSGGTLGTTPITFFQMPMAAGYGASNFIDKETPSGIINGSNVSFTLANAPVAGSEHIFLNGILQDVGAGNDYTITGVNITLTTAPLAGEKIRVSYRK